MPSTHSTLYKNRIFGDDQTPPKMIPSKKPSALYDPTRPSWYTEENSPKPAQDPLANDNTVYPFKRDLLASARLNLQHYHFVSTTNFLLHPSILLKPNALVADIGCGTGIWSLELSKTLPEGGRIEAFDLSLDQTPKAFAPENVSFKQLDIFTPLPERLVGRFDVVNIRLVMCVISSGDPLPLMRQLMELVKPGGCLQWQEYDSTTDRLVASDPALPIPKLQALREHLQTPGFGTWVKDLHTRFDEAGGELVKHERHWTRKEDIIVKQDISFMAAREWATKLTGSEEGKKLEKLVQEAEEECWELGRGVFVDGEIVTWVVKKA